MLKIARVGVFGAVGVSVIWWLGVEFDKSAFIVAVLGEISDVRTKFIVFDDEGELT